MKFKFAALLLLSFLLVIVLPGLVHAQTLGDPGCDPFDEYCPIDGGLSLLIAAGIGIGAKKAYDSKKKGDITKVVE